MPLAVRCDRESGVRSGRERNARLPEASGTGGSGTMLQGFLGMLVLGLLSNALNMAGVSSFLQTLVVGIVILLAVIVDRWRTNKG